MKTHAHFALILLVVGCGGDDPKANDTNSTTVATTVETTTTGTETTTGSTATWPLSYGRWGVPAETFTLPSAAIGEGLYYPDVQATFDTVDWSTLDRLYIPAGSYAFISLGNLPDRDPAHPLIITNIDGQVHIGSHDHYYLFSISGGSNWVLTGRYDPDSQTGDVGYPGHWGGNYANSGGDYGIFVDDAFVRDSVSGIGIGGGATDFEVEFAEVTRVGFAGMTIKTDDDDTATMRNVSIHDTYVHDTLSEGFYIGSTQAQPQHQIIDLDFYNNRVLRAGTESIQVGQTGGGIHLHHNVFGPSATHWKDAFQAYQDGNLQLGIRSGSVEVDHNVFLGAADTTIGVFPALIPGDTYPTSWEIDVHDNYLAHTRERFMYFKNEALPGCSNRVRNNSFRGRDYQRDELDAGNTPGNELIRTFTPDPLAIDDNQWESDINLSNPLPDGNGTDGSNTGSGNVAGPVTPISFQNAGLADDFDYLKIEVWSATAGLGGGAPITYELDDITMVGGLPFRCTVASCAAGNNPVDTPGEWEALPAFPDDVRTVPGSAHDGIGLNY